jgi:ADP-ribose pyrophosphatase YjhB (NUDIX family)
MKRGKVWLAVAGLVIDKEGNWLVVKKRYGGLKGMWSLPAGFVNEGETVDEAVIREVKEETGLTTTVNGIIGVRTGVIGNEISDNMIIFHLNHIETDQIEIEKKELFDVKWMSPNALMVDGKTSVMIHEMLKQGDLLQRHQAIEGLDPGEQFGYTSYKLFM